MGNVCQLSRDGTINEAFLDEFAGNNNIVRSVERALAGRAGGYQSFLINFWRLRQNIRHSSRLLANSANGCSNSVDPASMVLMDWHRHQQGNPRSIYAVMVNP